MRFRLQVDGNEYRVMASPNGVLQLEKDRFETKVTAPAPDRRVVQIGENTYEIRIVETQLNPGSFLLEIAGERIVLGATEVTRGRTLESHPAAPVEAAASLSASRGGTDGHDELENAVRAPMPGRVVKLLVDTGEQVQAGQVMLILEAMKMENELRAPCRGSVRSVLVKAGDPVEAGKPLLILDPDSSAGTRV